MSDSIDSISLADIATQLNVAKTMAIALPRFYKQTNLMASIIFKHNADTKDIEISLGFEPRSPTREEYSILFEELTNAEKLLINQYIITTAPVYPNINQLIFKHKEETNQIIANHSLNDN